MSQLKVQGTVREQSGKGVARKLRSRGRIPGVLYGRHMDRPISLDVDGKELDGILRSSGRTALIHLHLEGPGGGDHTAMIVDWQKDVLGNRLIHIDFKQVALDEKVRAKVPLVLVGSSVGVKLGGVLEQTLRDLEIEALPLSVPSQLEVDISGLEAGGSVPVSAIAIPEGVSVVTALEETVAVVHQTRAAAAAASAKS